MTNKMTARPSPRRSEHDGRLHSTPQRAAKQEYDFKFWELLMTGVADDSGNIHPRTCLQYNKNSGYRSV